MAHWKVSAKFRGVGFCTLPQDVKFIICWFMVIIFGAQSVLLSATAGSEIDHILGSLSNQDYKGKKKGYISRKTTPTIRLQSQTFLSTQED